MTAFLLLLILATLAAAGMAAGVVACCVYVLRLRLTSMAAHAWEAWKNQGKQPPHLEIEKPATENAGKTSISNMGNL